MQLFTNCNTCVFLKDEKCDGNLWDSPGFQNKVRETEDGMTIIAGRICPTHRTNTDQPFEEVRNTCRLSYALVAYLSEDKDANNQFLEDIKPLFDNRQTKPLGIYLIDGRDDRSDILELKKSLEKFGVKYKIKNVLVANRPDKFIDEFVTTRSMGEQFYFYTNIEDKIDYQKFLRGLWNLIYKDMQQVLYAGSNSAFYLAAGLHQICKNGFKEYLLENNFDHAVFSTQEILDKA